MRIVLSLFFCVLASVAAAQNINRLHCEAFESILLVSNEAGIINPSQFGAEVDLLAKYSERDVYRKLGVPVGRLDSQVDTDGPSDCWPCTAFLIAPGRLMTNHHCSTGLPDMLRQQGVAQPERVTRVRLIMGYMNDDAVSPEDGVKVYEVDPQPIEANKELDYAIMKVDPAATDDFGVLKLSDTMPAPNDSLFVIGHPRGLAKRLSLRQCRVKERGVVGRRLQHRCSTLPGSSGSPVFDNNSRIVVALHSAAAARISTDDVTNLAVPMAMIAESSSFVAGLIGSDAGSETAPAAPTVETTSEEEVIETTEETSSESNDSVVDAAPPVQDAQVISTLQSELNRHHCNAGNVDGSFGRSSERAIAYFNSLKPAGCDDLLELDRVGRRTTAEFLAAARTNLDRLRACKASGCGLPIPQGFQRTIDSGCFYGVGTSKLEPGEFVKWSGSCDANGFATGQGVLEYVYPVTPGSPHISRFEGTMCQGDECGPGNLLISNGTAYVGEFAGGTSHGQGKLTYPSGASWTGNFKNGRQDGAGTFVDQNGKSRTITFRNGKQLR